jgi:hypothetical protein
MATLLNELRDLFRDGATFVADKADEMAKIGKLRFDILAAQRNIDKLFGELGSRTYELVATQAKPNILKDEEVQKTIDELKKLEKSLESKREEIENVKQEKAKAPKEGEKSKEDKESDDDIEEVDVEEVKK